MSPGRTDSDAPLRLRPSWARRRAGTGPAPASAVSLHPRRLLRKAHSFQRQPLFVQLWFLPVWILLGISKALIFTVPFQRLAPHLGRPTGVTPWLPLLGEEQARRARLIGQVVRMTARYTPWEANCFPQAIRPAVCWACMACPMSSFFGLARTPEDAAGMKAHAWVAAGPVRVTGGYSFDRFTVVGCFAESNLASGLPL